MNWKHIEAVIKGSGRFHRCQHEGMTLITNEHIALIWEPGSFELQNSPEYEALARLWPQHTADMKQVVKPGGLFPCGRNYARAMDPAKEFIDEAFFRCFDSPRTTWRLGFASAHGDGSHSVVALVDEKPVALIMPIRASRSGGCIMEDVADADVFHPFCSEENGFYLISVAKLREQLDDAQMSLEQKRQDAMRIESEIEDYQSLIRSLEARISVLNVERAESLAQRTSD
jgi:hypothetical protein